MIVRPNVGTIDCQTDAREILLSRGFTRDRCGEWWRHLLNQCEFNFFSPAELNWFLWLYLLFLLYLTQCCGRLGLFDKKVVIKQLQENLHKA